jgi:hypothetical protein
LALNTAAELLGDVGATHARMDFHTWFEIELETLAYASSIGHLHINKPMSYSADLLLKRCAKCEQAHLAGMAC